MHGPRPVLRHAQTSTTANCAYMDWHPAPTPPVLLPTPHVLFPVLLPRAQHAGAIGNAVTNVVIRPLQRGVGALTAAHGFARTWSWSWSCRYEDSGPQESYEETTAAGASKPHLANGHGVRTPQDAQPMYDLGHGMQIQQDAQPMYDLGSSSLTALVKGPQRGHAAAVGAEHRDVAPVPAQPAAEQLYQLGAPRALGLVGRQAAPVQGDTYDLAYAGSTVPVRHSQVGLSSSSLLLLLLLLFLVCCLRDTRQLASAPMRVVVSNLPVRPAVALCCCALALMHPNRPFVRSIFQPSRSRKRSSQCTTSALPPRR